MALPFLFQYYKCLLINQTSWILPKVSMSTGHVESDFVWQNSRCWQEMFNSYIVNIFWIYLHYWLPVDMLSQVSSD